MATLVSDRYGAADSRGAGGDAALVSGLRAGSRDAFEQLYDLYRGQIYNLTLRIVQSPEDACDITQEVFIKAFRKLPDSPVTDLHLTPWLYRVAVNASYDHLRTRRLHRDIDALGADSCAVPVDTFEQAEMGRRVEQTLAALSERHRTVLVLKDIHGLRHDEIAEILGISRNATETLLFRARDAFRVKYLELTQGQPGSHNVEKWSAAGIGLGVFLHQMPLPAALQGGFPFGAAGAGGAGAAAASGAGTAASGAGTAASGAGTAAGAAASGAGGASTGVSLATGGLLAKVGGVATAKIAAVVIAATVAAGGGAAAYKTGALPGLHHRLPPHAAHTAQTHTRAGGSSLPEGQGASGNSAQGPGTSAQEPGSSAQGPGNSAQAPGAAVSAAAKARAAAKKAAHDQQEADKGKPGGSDPAAAKAAAKAESAATRAAAKADKAAARAAAKADKAAAKADKNAGGNSGNSNAGGNGGNSNAGGNSGNSNAGGNSGNSNAGGNSGSSNAGGSGGNSGSSNAGGNSGSSNAGGNSGGNSGSSNAGGNSGSSNAGGNSGSSNAGGNSGDSNAGGGSDKPGKGG